MNTSSVTIEQQFTIRYAFPVHFGHHLLRPEEPLLASVFQRAGDKPHRFLCYVDSGVHEGNPAVIEHIEEYVRHHRRVMQLAAPVCILQGGEACKNDPGLIDRLLEHVRRYQLCRHSFVLAIGGGALIDAVGYAAAVAHRGVRLIRMPTTVLGQNDAGIGVKCGINWQGRKNFVGSFAPPFAVINDSSFLDTLPPREMRSGMAEAVKVALIKDGDFFAMLCAERHLLAQFHRQPMEELIRRCAALHMTHIGGGGDPFELGSARPLDFGHWSAHKLEEMTRGALNHGEAVSIGIALDSLYSQTVGLIDDAQLQQILTLLADLGLPLWHPALAELDVGGALAEFQEHLGGEQSITLLTGIGSMRQVERIDTGLMRRCVHQLLALSEERQQWRVDKTPQAVLGESC